MVAVIREPGSGERYVGDGREVVIKATGNDTDGLLFLAEMVIPPGYAGPPLHRHSRLHDMFYVLEGTLSVRLDDQEYESGPGTFVSAPPDVAHTFANNSDQPVRLLNFTAPAGWEHYMREIGEAARLGSVPPEKVAEISANHDCEIL